MARFNKGFSITNQILWEIRFDLNSTLINNSLQNCVHDRTVVLSWDVQKFLATLRTVIWWQQDDISRACCDYITSTKFDKFDITCLLDS